MRSIDTRPAWAEIDLDALATNLDVVRALAGPSKRLIASVKADAYGHGVVDIGLRLVELGVDALATGSFDDAIALRGAGVACDLLMFAGPSPEAMGALLDADVIPTIYDAGGARAVSATGRAARVFVKVDCGLGRIGVPLADAADFVRSLNSMPGVEIEGIYTHVPFHDRRGRDWSQRRIAAFEELVRALGNGGLRIPVTQAMASAHLAAGMSDGCTAVCPGHLLYGVSPVGSEIAMPAGFRPVLRAVRARLVHVARHRVPHTFGVGGALPLAAGAVTGVLPVGLGDGHRNAAPGAHASVLVRGRRAPVLGVSLEHTTVDLGAVEGAAVGDVATIVGIDGDDSIDLAEVAAAQRVGPLDVLTRFSGRLVRTS